MSGTTLSPRKLWKCCVEDYPPSHLGISSLGLQSCKGVSIPSGRTSASGLSATGFAPALVHHHMSTNNEPKKVHRTCPCKDVRLNWPAVAAHRLESSSSSRASKWLYKKRRRKREEKKIDIFPHLEQILFCFPPFVRR